jgi:Flp pilus assembly protein TadD
MSSKACHRRQNVVRAAHRPRAAGLVTVLLGLAAGLLCTPALGGERDTLPNADPTASAQAHTAASARANPAPAAQALPSEATHGQDEATHGETESAAQAREHAAEALANGDADAALSYYRRAAALDPSDTESLCEIGEIYAQRGDARLAARAYAQAVQTDPRDARALQGLGFAYLRLDNEKAGQTLLKRAVDADPGSWRAHNILGVLADGRDEHDAAIEHYTVALALSPGNPAILTNRGYSRYLAGDFRRAEQDLTEATAADPEDRQAWRNLGLVYAHERKYGLAMHALSQVTNRAVAANDVGVVAMQRGDYRGAEILFAEALRRAAGPYEEAERNAAKLRGLRSAADERELSSANRD